MNAIQKATCAASALAITLVGALLVSAPVAFARPAAVVAFDTCSPSSLQLAFSGHVRCNAGDGGNGAGLIALDRR